MIFFQVPESENPRVVELLRRQLESKCALTDRIFSYLLSLQWIFAIICAALVSPLTWSGATSSIHIHLAAAVVFGAVLTIFPVYLTLYYPGARSTRLVVASAQALYSTLIIHLMAGRIEAHFHVFVSLAILAAYRDRTVFLPAIAIIGIDHLLRGHFYPLSIFGGSALGDSQAIAWRVLEHIGWALFEVLSLSYIVGQNLNQVLLHARLEDSIAQEKEHLASRVADRTRELEDARAFQDCVLNSIDAQICILSDIGEVVFVNQKWLNFAKENGAPEDFTGLGENYLHVCDQADGDCSVVAKQVAAAIREIIAGTRESFVAEYPCDNATTKRWFQIRINSVPFEGRTSVAVVHVDVTSVKAAQSRAASLAKLVLESPNELFLFKPDNLRFVEVNQGACQNLQYSREELVKLTPVDINPDYSEPQFRLLIKRLQDPTVPYFEIETNHTRKDGTLYPCNIKYHRATFDDADVIVAFLTDLTVRKQLESKLSQAQKLESLGQLAAGIAHEINTPMQCVFGNVEFLQNAMQRLFTVTDSFTELLDKSGVNWDEQRKLLAEIAEQQHYSHIRSQVPLAIDEATEASRRVISIVRAMKVMSHPGTAEKVPTDLSELMQNAVTITRNRWKYVANLEFDFDPELGEVDALPAELSQVFINMLVNAADAIVERIGGEPCTLGTIRITTRRIGPIAEISFQDTGCGMREEVRRRIFDPFFTTKQVGKGTGQGLAISYDVIVNKHGGAIEVRSEPNVGSTFVLKLPVVHDDEGNSEFSGIPSGITMPNSNTLMINH